MQIVIAGASGFLGTHLSDELIRRGHAVTALVRRPTSAPDESTWDPYAGIYDRGVIEGADVVVNLAGSPTAGNPHSKKWARELRESRVTTTRVLARAVADSEQTPGVPRRQRHLAATATTAPTSSPRSRTAAGAASSPRCAVSGRPPPTRPSRPAPASACSGRHR